MAEVGRVGFAWSERIVRTYVIHRLLRVRSVSIWLYCIDSNAVHLGIIWISNNIADVVCQGQGILIIYSNVVTGISRR